MTIEDAAPKSKKSDPAIMIVALLVFGIVFGGLGLYRYNMGKKSISWPAAKGKITYSHAASRRVENSYEYHPSVKYTYSVDRRSYTGKRITASDVYQKTLSGAKDILKKYPVGGEVSVYYDPADPGTSLLETGMKKNVYVLLGGAALCFLFATATIVSELKKKKLVTG
ncbi:MAG: DUF3592 domain-containing protein [Desulfobacteraceae bacterium]|nr:DUF3592 domain-containing protein [Desulfobacteraceae bacterium]MBC2755361.1 DUF3592 domain-containing protein [Desulfobacteraceae bacterium]